MWLCPYSIDSYIRAERACAYPALELPARRETAQRTDAAADPPKRKARQLAKYLRAERPDYPYLKELFRHLRTELDVAVTHQPDRLPYVPTEDEIRRYYQTVWNGRRSSDIVLIKTLLYTGVRVAELVAIRLDDVDLDACRILSPLLANIALSVLDEHFTTKWEGCGSAGVSYAAVGMTLWA